MGFSLNYDSSNLGKNLDSMSLKLGALLLMYSATKAEKIKADMHSNRKWTDRTGMAKTTLDAKVSQPEEDIIRITLSYGVDYGLWLELANEKNYAIIAPTINDEGPRIISDLQDIMSKLKL